MKFITSKFRLHRINTFIILLFMLLLFHGLNNYYILAKSRYCLSPDNVTYFGRIIQISQAFENVKLNLKSLYGTYLTIFNWGFKPPLFFLTAIPFLSFGADKNIIIMSNLIYLAILLFATYGIGKILFDSKIVGFFSAFSVSMFPTVFALSRVLVVDFALMSMVALTFYLFSVNKFYNLKFSLLTGIIIGLSSLTKQTYFIFILPILLCFLLRKNNLKNKEILRNFVFSIILGFLIAASYYLPEFYSTITYGFYTTFQEKKNPMSLYYLYTLLRRQLLPIFFLLFLISIGFLLKKKKYSLFTMIFMPLVIFSMSSSKADRYILPIFPYIAIAICGFIYSLSKGRKILWIMLVIFSFFQYFVISYKNVLPVAYNFSQNFLFAFEQGFIESNGLMTPIDEGDWETPGREIINIIEKNVKRNKTNRDIRVLFIGQTWRIWTTTNYLQLIESLPVELYVTAIDSDFIYRPSNIQKDFDNHLMQSDLIIVEEILPENRWIHTKHLLNAFKRNSDKFNFIKTVVFPGNLSCHVYKKETNSMR